MTVALEYRSLGVVSYLTESSELEWKVLDKNGDSYLSKSIIKGDNNITGVLLQYLDTLEVIFLSINSSG
jgi:hypothetical protein